MAKSHLLPWLLLLPILCGPGTGESPQPPLASPPYRPRCGGGIANCSTIR